MASHQPDTRSVVREGAPRSHADAAHDDAAAASRDGALHRAAAVLRLLATAGRRGLALTDLAKAAGLPNSTMHRLLQQLQDERLAMRIESSRHYTVGPLAYEIGLAAAQQFDIRGLLRPALEALARDAGETAYLIMRSGDEAVCIDVAEGPTPLRVVTLHIGSRRPLGLGAGGLAILSALPPDERKGILENVTARIERHWGFPPELLAQSLQEATRRGHAVIRNRVNPGVTAVGMPFFDSLGQVIGAVTVAAANARMEPARLAQLQQLLERTSRDLRDALSGHQWRRRED
ncbi:IclR family transcriptional regulator [Variovorax ureilyticus]|uniref:IclR family transcriptional regulator n=1 Tax=Variovorax ureilyticus TaxID=1836198 RepID=A0ABU8VN83_9BURK